MSTSQSAPHSPSKSPQQDEPVIARVAAAFDKLAASAAELNVASDEFARPISDIDTALQKLNLGVSAWVKVAGGQDGRYEWFWEHSLGYAKVSSGWGIAIRTLRGDYTEPDEEIWRFNDAPRSYRLEALERLPELLEELAKVSSETALALKSRITTTKQVAMTISQMAPSAKPVRRK